MSNETLQLLKAFIDAAGYDVEAYQDCEPGGLPFTDYKVTKKKRKPRTQTKSEGYTSGFNYLWDMYGKVGNKKAANRQYEARAKDYKTREGLYSAVMDGVKSYNKFIEATGQYKKNFETFLGRDKHYLNDFTIPEQAKKASKPEWAKLPFDENQLEAHAIKHGLQRPGRMDSFQQYRSKLQIEINKRLEE